MSSSPNQVKTLLDNLAKEWAKLGNILNNLAIALVADLPLNTGLTRALVESTIGSTDPSGAPIPPGSLQDLCVGTAGLQVVTKSAGAAAGTAATSALAISGALTALATIEGKVSPPSGRAQLDSIFRTFITPLTLNDALSLRNIASGKIADLKGIIRGIADTLQADGSPSTPQSNLADIRDAVDNLSSYPVLFSDVNSNGGGAWGGGSGATGLMAPSSSSATGVLARTVESAMRDVLGRIPRQSDTRSFLSALKASFDVTEFEGHTTFTWNPRAYAGQSELGGGVTGAQASLWTRARVAVDNAGSLLDKVYPLKVDFDPQKVDSFRSIIRTTFRTLVDELGIEGGPRAPRVDNLFTQLLGQADGAIIKFDKPPGSYNDSLFGQFQLETGLVNTFVTTLDEENVLTNFIAL